MRLGPSRGEPTRPGAALSEVSVRPVRSKGQNFLTQAAVADRIVALAQLTPEDEVVEIGPGLGILSERISAAYVRRFTMVELDRALAERLRRRFFDQSRVHVIQQDFLKFDLHRWLGASSVKVLGNLPFSVASAVLRKLCDHQAAIARMVLTFQREVARRIRALPGDDDYGALSVFTAMYWIIEDHFVVAPGSFHPRPKVAAEVLSMIPNPAPGFERQEEAVLARLIRAAFSAPRKMLRNNMMSELGISPAMLDRAFHEAAIEPQWRAHQLGLADFGRLLRALTR